MVRRWPMMYWAGMTAPRAALRGRAVNTSAGSMKMPDVPSTNASPCWMQTVPLQTTTASLVVITVAVIVSWWWSSLYVLFFINCFSDTNSTTIMPQGLDLLQWERNVLLLWQIFPNLPHLDRRKRSLRGTGRRFGGCQWFRYTKFFDQYASRRYTLCTTSILYLKGFPYSDEFVWIGGKKDTDDKWEWKSGKKFEEYTNWNVGEPNGDGDNLEMYSNGKWNDVSRYNNRALCQGLYAKMRYLSNINYSLRWQ